MLSFEKGPRPQRKMAATSSKAFYGHHAVQPAPDLGAVPAFSRCCTCSRYERVLRPDQHGIMTVLWLVRYLDVHCVDKERYAKRYRPGLAESARLLMAYHKRELIARWRSRA